MKLVRRAKFSRVFVPNRPVIRKCERCGEERPFRLLIHTEFSDLLWVLQWDFKEMPYRVCAECNTGYRMSMRELKEIFPTFSPPAPRIVRQAVAAMFWVPMLLYLVWLGISVAWLGIRKLL
jgi:hypothetical protein